MQKSLVPNKEEEKITSGVPQRGNWSFVQEHTLQVLLGFIKLNVTPICEVLLNIQQGFKTAGALDRAKNKILKF